MYTVTPVSYVILRAAAHRPHEPVRPDEGLRGRGVGSSTGPAPEASNVPSTSSWQRARWRSPSGSPGPAADAGNTGSRPPGRRSRDVDAGRGRGGELRRHGGCRIYFLGLVPRPTAADHRAAPGMHHRGTRAAGIRGATDLRAKEVPDTYRDDISADQPEGFRPGVTFVSARSTTGSPPSRPR